MGAGIWFIFIIPMMLLYIIDREFGTDILDTLKEYIESNPEFVEKSNVFFAKALEVIIDVINFVLRID